MGYVKFMLGYLTGDQIIFIVSRYRDEHIGSLGADLRQGSCLTTVTPDADTP